MFHARLRPDVELRLVEERHAPALFAAVDQDRQDLRQWLAWVDATKTQDDILAFIRASLEKFSTNSGVTVGVWCENRLAGVIGTHPIDWLNRRVELGYWLGRAFRGGGIMTEATRALTRYAVLELDL